jgi:hypothetical protein
VVIFGLLIGEELAGLVGILLAIPVVVIVKETVLFALERMSGQRAPGEESPQSGVPEEAGGPVETADPAAAAAPTREAPPVRPPHPGLSPDS